MPKNMLLNGVLKTKKVRMKKDIINIALDHIINIVNITAEHKASAEKTRELVYEAVEFARKKIMEDVNE